MGSASLDKSGHRRCDGGESWGIQENYESINKYIMQHSISKNIKIDWLEENFQHSC